MLRAAVRDDLQLLRESLQGALAADEDPVQAAVDHGLAPLLQVRLHEHSLLDQLPPEQRERLRQIHRRTLTLHSGAFAVTHQTLDLLREHGLDEALPLKGVALAALHWPDPLPRSLVDLDLLISPGQIIAARELLVQAGYAAPPIPWVPTPWEYHLPRLECHGLGVELHWRLWPPSPLQPFRLPDAPALLGRSITGTLNDRPLPIPSKPDQLLITSAALAQDGFAVGLRAWADVYWLLQRMDAGEVEQAWGLAAELGSQHYLSLVLRGVRDIIGQVPVDEPADPLAQQAYHRLAPLIWQRLLLPDPPRASLWVLRALCRQAEREDWVGQLPPPLREGLRGGSVAQAMIHSGGALLSAGKLASRAGRWLVSGRERLALRQDLLLCRVLRGLAVPAKISLSS